MDNLHIRAHLHIDTTAKVNEFVAALNSVGTVDHYSLENMDGTSRVNARSIVGVIYAMTEFDDNMFFVNDTNNGIFPSVIDAFRA